MAGIVPCTDPYAKPKRVSIRRLKLVREDFTPSYKDHPRNNNFDCLEDESTSTDDSCTFNQGERTWNEQHSPPSGEHPIHHNDAWRYSNDSTNIAELNGTCDIEPESCPASHLPGPYHDEQENDMSGHERQGCRYKLRRKIKKNRMPDYVYYDNE
ncbi:uncharacterized protein [Watersipora subatra]|uniref:uncharacterized protein n=1 Tax=Watersipora subatra TaxID=2589382 RepID=UPI00355B10FB